MNSQPVDIARLRGLTSPMRYRDAYQFYLEALRKEPNLPEPPLRVETAEAFHEWKEELRARDAARIDLGLTTATEVQARNTAFPRTGTRPKILTQAFHGRAAAEKRV